MKLVKRGGDYPSRCREKVGSITKIIEAEEARKFGTVDERKERKFQRNTAHSNRTDSGRAASFRRCGN